MVHPTGFLDRRAGLAGRTAAIIGGGGGIGAGITLALAEAGVDVAICDIDGEQLAVTAAAAVAIGSGVHSAVIDATAPDQLDRFYDEVTSAFGHLDVVVNVVGGTYRTNLMDLDRAAIARDIQRNYGYVVQSVQRAVPLLRAGGRRGGSIINFTTIEAHRGAATFAVYAGAKAATTNFTRAVAVELGKEGIRLNCIAPDTTPSRGNENAMPPEVAAGYANVRMESIGRAMAMYIPAGSPPPVDALANAVLFLASDLAAYVSGMTLHVDGGTMAASGFLDWPHGDGFVPVALNGTVSKMFPVEPC